MEGIILQSTRNRSIMIHQSPTSGRRAGAKFLILIMIVIAACLAGCNGQTCDYISASSISENGFARNDDEIRKLQGQEVKIWGFIDHSNLYGDESARELLGDWWSGAGPDTTTWRFNLKANANDEAGHSFQIHIPNDPGRDNLLKAFLADAKAKRPTKVFIKGKLFTFDAPSNTNLRTGLTMVLQSSSDILLDLPAEQ